MANAKGKRGRSEKSVRIQLRTPEEARADFDRKGISIAEFARTHQLDQGTVYQVLSGQKKGRRGEAHRAAVLLGLKAGVITGAERHE